MTEKFESKALEANLAQTRYKNIKIPKPHKYFIGLSGSYYGIKKRATECLTEFSHPLSNSKFVVDQLREILLGDFWYYVALDDAEKAYDIVLEMFNQLLGSEIKKELRIKIIQTLVEFVELLTKHDQILYKTISHCLHIFTTNLNRNEESFIESSKFFIRHLTGTQALSQFKDPIFELTKDILKRNLLFWKRTSDIEAWLESKQDSFSRNYSDISDKIGEPYFRKLLEKIDKVEDWGSLIANFPTYDDVALRFSQLTDEFDTFIEKFYYSFYLLHLPGMLHMKERLIWSINKLMRSAVDEVAFNKLKQFIDRIFELSEELREEHSSSVLDYLLTLGKKIIDKDDTEEKYLISHFEKKLINFGFETPGIVYVNQDWQLNVNKNHIKNIRVWLELIEYPSSILERLLSSLIVNLKLGGIFISDTDLFQRDITKILNSNIAPYYKKVKQLTRIFPVYFNEIGAEGDIRKVTTSMDELSQRQDLLIHFLRKQVHTESNNTLIDLSGKIFKFWYDADLNALESVLPKDVYDSIELDSEWFAYVHKMTQDICVTNHCNYLALLDTREEEFNRMVDELPYENLRDKRRIKYLRKLHSLLKEKYSFDTDDIVNILKRYPFLNSEEIERFNVTLINNNFDKSLKMIYGFMEKLKQIIFNPQPSEGWENIYHKRHIAIGIPSMYGVYREKKFEALGLTFRLEKVATRLMEKVVDNINLDYISAKTLNRIHSILEYFKEGLELDGIYSQGLSSNLQMLKYSLTSRSFSLDQYINIFQFIADDIKRTINKYFLKSYEYPLRLIIPQLFDFYENQDEKSKNRFLNKKSEEFYRDIISEAFLVQPLDNLITKIIDSLRNMADNLPPELIGDVMSYNSDLVISPLDKDTIEIDNQIFLGSKAYYLKKLYLAGFPVPEGFVITTEIFRRRNAISNHQRIKEEFDRMIDDQIRHLERVTRKQYGNPDNPLLLAVRSGTAISMPGAMNTFLNVGMNDEFTEKLSKQTNFGWTSWDSYRRLIQSWGMANGISRDEFDHTMQEYKIKYNVDQKANFEPVHMKQIAKAYKQVLYNHDIKFEEDPYKQLAQAINYVFDSWGAERARVYRENLQIADEWGTAVVVQKMVLGNLYKNAGTGVIFTQNPQGARPGVHLYGDFTFCSQGEDIVGGLVYTLPVSENQRKQLNITKKSLQTSMPQIYKRLFQLAEDMIENHGYGPQEIEFTFESENPEDVYILQTRDLFIQKRTLVDIFNLKQEKMYRAGRGIGIGGGAMNGVLAFDMEDLEILSKTHPDDNHILVRPDTVPDDIGMIFECDGLLTAKGGATSHAAVTAVQLGKVCIVNCTQLHVNEKKKECSINGIVFKSGDKIAIDGYLGVIYKGNYPIRQTEIIPTI